MEKMELSEALKANASVLEGLFTSLKLFPFMFRGDVNVTSYDETGAFGNVVTEGKAAVSAAYFYSGAYGRL